jgi:predicted nuclease of predicted toxin-antitoxin system
MVPMPLLCDENLPQSVANYLTERGHNVSYVRDLFLGGTPDAIIAAVADKNGWIVVTCDRDYRQIAARIPKGGKAALKRMGRISLRCHPAHAVLKTQEHIELIEFEYGRRLSQKDKRLIVEITETTVVFAG